MRIVFMGTPEFAVPSLKLLSEKGCELAGVITAPDKPAGRGKKLQASAVKEAALELGLKVLQPEKLKAPEFLEELRALRADLQIVVAFRMLPEEVWNMPPLGTFNLHASLLPQYRGAAPINWAIMNGETETGLTTFFLQHEIDTGHIIFQEKEPIYPEDNAGTLYERLKTKGANLVVKTVEAIKKREVPKIPQSEEDSLKSAPKIFKETCEIDWTHSSEQIYNFVRGLAPVPGAWTILRGKFYKIYETILLQNSEQVPPDYEDKVFSDQRSFLWIKTGSGWLSICSLQPEGKKKMDIRAFLAGNRL